VPDGVAKRGWPDGGPDGAGWGARRGPDGWPHGVARRGWPDGGGQTGVAREGGQTGVAREGGQTGPDGVPDGG
jgi:hypothetical protein